ncbi:MAG TPA: SMP-30/gluconolactonase/LRE family protein [Chloroflexota bacterium]|nr:SMP-30/gluconolactonase/LRE family protein [Chloroflexota bacterium]
MAWLFDLVAGPFKFTEGPVWNGQSVLFSDIPNDRIMRYDPRSGECTEFRTNTNGTNGLTLDRQGRLYACESRGRRVVRHETDGSTTVLADHFEGKRLNSPNDIVVDARGRVWFTDPCYGDRAQMELDHDSVYRLDPRSDGGHDITRVTFDTTRPNGLVFSPDEQTLYLAESPPAPDGRRQLRAYPVRADGTLGDMTILHDFGLNRGIDGMRIDAEGNVVAAAGWDKGGPGPRIAVFAPDGTVLADHPVPNNPTNCTFGDEDLRTLYVTDYAGSLYRARTDRVGPRR